MKGELLGMQRNGTKKVELVIEVDYDDLKQISLKLNQPIEVKFGGYY